ncbi:rhomboid family intramembrane serine protease [Roseospira marina]|uniref:Rhomboid family intramembrane serine protease n=1 Tax=Roseospira marina TaxID=140057 RepID=A0A5M6IH15_9PROT|nr:rhomboid family intramembrane serine protease [Roseospira marina]KAA5606965.1 rhomboid family intramembrane serine protease [Roseospira marina]MBB4312857.1 membrane associated rhomboid family serine protease [Roseospira marina]MBB5086370.1 membrane associated rhomboid family serine protease [Roseospira marina]
MLPLRDDNPTSRTPYVTWGLIAVCVLASLYQLTLDPRQSQMLIIALGAIPVVLTGQETLPPALALVPAYVTPLTAMFLHGDLLHLGGNMLYLWIFGNNVEDAMGSLRFLAFYLIAGFAATALHVLQDADSIAPMVGASGAISGVLGAYLILFPWARVFVWFGFVFVFWVPAIFVLGLWFGLQALSLLSDPTGAESGVAWWAHVGGFVVGLILTPLMKRKEVPLFSRRRTVRRISVVPRVGEHAAPRRRGPWDDPKGPWGAGRP